LLRFEEEAVPARAGGSRLLLTFLNSHPATFISSPISLLGACMSETSTLKLGDIVSLKSGGPKMTVCEIISPSSTRCIWFADNKLMSDNFVPATLYLEPAK
jgi:uncharacterized protein YodC (DUF2158 family)